MTAPALKTEYSGVVGRCKEALSTELSKRLDAFFEQLDDSFYELADKAGTNAQQELYFDAMREVRKQREVAENRINEHIKLGFDRFWQTGSQQASQPAASRQTSLDDLDGDFELVANGDLEEDLAISTMVSKGNNSFYRDLYALEQRFSVMLGGAKVESANNPLGPSAFGTAIKQAISSLEMDITVKLVIYKQFEREVIDQLGVIYDALNDLMAKADILPKLKRSVRQQNRQAAARRSASMESADDLDQYAVDAVAVESEVFSTLQSLLVQRRGDVLMPPGHENLQLVPASELVGLLSGLQATLGDGWVNVNAPGDAAQTIKGALSVGGDSADRRINQSDEDVIDVISMLFEFILEDPSLPDAMRAMLARLQIPMLKVAILDKSFFSKTEHPARRLLNSLAQSAVGWGESMGRGDGSLFGRIEAIVERIMREFDDDIGLFEELYQQFSEFQESEQKGAGIAENRAAQVTQGKERLVGAKAEVDRVINAALTRSMDEVPVVVKNLLTDGWKGVLLTIYLREGDESAEWESAIDTMDKLIWSVQPKPDVKERQALLKTIPQLLKRLRTGLGGISYDQHKMASMFKTLQACHVKCLRSTSVKQRAMEVSRVKQMDASEKTEQATDKPENTAESGFELDEERVSVDNISEEIVLETPAASFAPEEEIKDKFTEMAETLEKGTWIERTNEQGEVVRAKLSWRSGITGVCLFVNRKGIKVAEVSPQALAAWFRGGSAVVLEGAGVPLMDRALSAMVDVLNRDTPKKEK